MVRVRLLLLLLSIAPACVLPSEPRSPFRVNRAWGSAGAETEAEAERLAELVEETRRVFEQLEGFEDRPLRAHSAEDVGPEKLSGISAQPAVGSPWIAVRRTADELEHTLAHELAHFYFDPLMSRFPSVLEEGMAEYLGDRVFPAPKRRERLLVFVAASYLESFTVEVRGAGAKVNLAYLVQPVPTIEEVFDIGWYENLKADPRVNETLYGLGWLIAERIGWEGLNALVRRCDREGLERVPPEWIRSAADIEPPTDENLQRVLYQAFGAEGEDPQATFRITLQG